jgi:hypothetical protein
MAACSTTERLYRTPELDPISSLDFYPKQVPTFLNPHDPISTPGAEQGHVLLVSTQTWTISCYVLHSHPDLLSIHVEPSDTCAAFLRESRTYAYCRSKFR